MKINNIKYDLKVSFNKETFIKKDLNKDLSEVFPIRGNTILYKSKTGLGATYNEIISPRHSIIVLPHISIIKSKHTYHTEVEDHDTFAVYGEISGQKIQNYLLERTRPAKFLTTPKGVVKILQAVESFGLNTSEHFFMLIDECHKLIQDAQYRTDMVELMDCFFSFNHKAMVSATAIPPSDPRFSKQQFKHIHVFPNYEKKKKVKLIHSDSLVNGLKSYISNRPDVQYCIFFNSVKGIVSLIDQLGLKEKSKIFCSEESRDLLSIDRNDLIVSNKLSEYKQFNFFTSSFFNGLDIYICHPIRN